MRFQFIVNPSSEAMTNINALFSYLLFDCIDIVRV